MKLFVSYRRKSWPFTSQLVNNLRRRLDADIFVDYEGVDETNFEKSILRHLRACDVVLLIVSEYTFASPRIQQHDDWVRREIREALALDKPIVAIFVDGLGFPADLPVDIRDIRGKQGVSFYPEYFGAGVKRLVEFMTKATPVQLAPLDTLEDEDATEDALPDVKATFSDAMKLFEEGDYDKSIFVMEELRDNGYAHKFLSLAGVLEDAKHHRDLERRLQDARNAYSDIAALARSKVMRDRACDAWKAFRSAYPDFYEDSENLAEKLGPPVPKQIAEIISDGSGRSPDALSLDDVLNYFVDSPLNPVSAPPVPAPIPNAKKGASSESARVTQEAKRLS
ncbi:MAG: toll/interleukin-1 receptor domain-containing protein [Chloroflexota bacterium]